MTMRSRLLSFLRPNSGASALGKFQLAVNTTARSEKQAGKVKRDAAGLTLGRQIDMAFNKIAQSEKQERQFQRDVAELRFRK